MKRQRASGQSSMQWGDRQWTCGRLELVVFRVSLYRSALIEVQLLAILENTFLSF